MKNNSKYSLVTLLLLLVTLTVNAQNYTVNSLADTNTGAGTSGTLRWCINQANLAAGPHTITFVAGGIGTILLTTNLPIISSADITIDGTSAGGAASIIIDAGAGDNGRRMFRVNAGGTNAIFKGMTVQDTGLEPFRIDGSPTGVTIEDIIITNTVTTCDCINYGVYVTNSATDLTIRNVVMTEGQTGYYGVYIAGTSNNVTIDGFDLSNSDPNSGIRMVGAANNVSILNTTLNLARDTGTSSGDNGINFSNTASNITLNTLTINDADNYALYFNSTTTTIDIDGFNFSNANGSVSTFGMRFVGVANGITMANVLLDLDNVTTTNDGDYGIYFNTTTSNVSIDGLTMHDAEVYGFYVAGVATDISILNSTFDNFDGWTNN